MAHSTHKVITQEASRIPSEVFASGGALMSRTSSMKTVSSNLTAERAASHADALRNMAEKWDEVADKLEDVDQHYMPWAINTFLEYNCAGQSGGAKELATAAFAAPYKARQCIEVLIDLFGSHCSWTYTSELLRLARESDERRKSDAP